MADTTPQLQTGASDHASAVFAGFLGWTLDAFDFFIVTLCVPEIAKTYGRKPSEILFINGVTLFMRPLGAFIFGLFADRYGRRRPMMVNLVFYSSMSVLSGLSPTFFVFVACRLLFGIGMGGEWGVGASLAMEKVPPRWRGVLSGLLQEDMPPVPCWRREHTFLSIRGLLGHTTLRPGSHCSGSVGSRRCLRYSFGFESKNRRCGKKPKPKAGPTSAKHWSLTGQCFSVFRLDVMMNLASHGTQDIFPTYLKTLKIFNPTPRHVAGVVAVSNVGAILGGVLVGLLSDHIGRRKAMAGSLLLATVMIPLWAYAPNLGVLLIGAFMIQFMVQGAWGVIPAHISELSPDSVRGFLPGFSYQCGVAVAGFISYFEDALKQHMPLNRAMAVTALVVFPLAAIVVSVGKESRAIVFGQNKEVEA